MIPSYAIIPTSNRPQVCLQAVRAIAPQVDAVFVVDNGDNEEVPDDEAFAEDYYVIRYDRHGGVPNLSLFWNLALDQIEVDCRRMGAETWDVAILNDDVIVCEGWFEAVAGAMREHGVAAASSMSPGGILMYREPGPVGLWNRMFGPAFVIAGEKGLRGDERLKWYFTDDYMDWESRKLGGVVRIPGFPVQHLYPDQQVTGAIQAQISADATLFKEMYGVMPW